MKYHKCTNLMKNGLGETKHYYCKGDYIWLDGNGNISSENRQEFGDEYHYDRWIKEIKKYVEKTNEGFEYNEEFIIKLCLSYTLQSLRNDENLKRFQWDTVNDDEEKILKKSCENCGYFYLFDEEAIQISREIGEDLDGFGECHYHGDFFHKKGLCNKWMDE